MTSIDGIPFRTIIEPNPQVYKGVGEQALNALKDNYIELQDRGCLDHIGTFGNVAEASNIKILCLQATFFTRVLPPLAVVLILAFELLILGRFLLRRALRLTIEDSLTELVFSAGVGAGGLIALLWLGAVLGIYVSLFGWALAVLVPLVFFRDSSYWLEKLIAARFNVTFSWYSVPVLIAWLLLSYLALNYLTVVRPFPIGWDDLGSYLNRPRLLVSYGSFIFSMQSFQWEYLTSLGFLLFGYDSIFGATSSLMINWMAGVLAIFAVWAFGRAFLGKGRGMLAALLYYTLPLVGHFSFADMKIDNAVFTMGALATFCVFIGVLQKRENKRVLLLWIFLGGLFAGLAFSMKITAIMVFLAIGAMIAGVLLHWSAFVGAVMLVGALLLQRDVIEFSVLMDRLQYDYGALAHVFSTLSFAILGALLIAFAMFRYRDKAIVAVLGCAVFLAGFAAAVFPWIEHNTIESGHIIPGMTLSAPNTITPYVDIFGGYKRAAYSLPPELAVNPKDPGCRATSGKEELDRYWGNLRGWKHYLTLPWRSVMNIDHAGYYVTTQPGLLLFPLLLLLPFFWRKDSAWLRWIWAATLFILVQWVFVANGVPWYGIGVFLGLVLCLEALVSKAPDVPSRWLAGLLVACSILIALGMRFWQYETQKNMYEYSIGKIGATTLRERTIPWYDDITDIVMERHRTMTDRPFLYRIGTFIPYFVPKNLEVIGMTDHQLDTFNCLNQEHDPKITVARLRALGFNSIVFDTNTATIERDQNGSLHTKVQALVDFLNSPDAGLQILVNDPDAGITFFLIP